MSDHSHCPQCGAALRPDAVEGLCPACLLNGVINPNDLRTDSDPGGPVLPEASVLDKQFPHLEILGIIGRGGMGIVYKARHKKLDRLVALKILSADNRRDPAFAERFSREARALARLDHPGIVTVYDFGQCDDVYFLLMQYVEGLNLRQVLRLGNLKSEEVLKIIPQICAALQYAHDEGIVHRDIKPENILLDRKGNVKLADFGLAKLLGTSPAESLLTASGQVMGTPHYLAPEQMERPLSVDHRADIYSLGVVFYEMLTGELPLGCFAPPSRKVPLDARLDPVVLRALEKEPERRYQHVSEVKTEVEALAPASRQNSRRDRWEVDPRLRWKILGVALGAYALAFFLPAYRYYSSWNNGPADHGWIAGTTDYGWSCFRSAWVMQYPCWYGNPAFWISWVLLALRKWFWAGVFALGAVILGLTIWNPSSQSSYLMGYWIWLASMALLLGTSICVWWNLKGMAGIRIWWSPSSRQVR